MKKRIVTAILMLCMVVGLCACGNGSTGNSQDTEKQNTEDSQKQEESESENSESEEADGKIVYKVKVVDQNGDAVAGASVQMCLDSCMWANTNDEGVAELKLAEADGYKAEVLALPEGYTEVNEEPVYLESGVTEITLTVEKQ